MNYDVNNNGYLFSKEQLDRHDKQIKADAIKRIIEHIKLYSYNNGTYVITDDVLDELKNLEEKNEQNE